MNKSLFKHETNSQPYKKRKLYQLTVDERINIVHSVIIDKEYHQDIAIRFGVNE